jgi:hypothetical protein
MGVARMALGVFPTNPSPSLFPFLLSPCHLDLSFAACWKKLTCGVIRSFNLFFSLGFLSLLFGAKCLSLFAACCG